MEGFREHYIRDAQGNIMAIYKYTNSGTASTKLVERPVYGSSRLGSYAKPQEVMGPGLISNQHTAPLVAADQRYELTDHLGNVNTVVSGRLLDGAGAGSQKQAEVLLAHGYEPFGALLPGRNYRQPTGPPPPPETPKGTLVITEFSNGPSQANGSASGECEYVELYVTKCALYPEAEEVDIRGWLIDDNAGNFNSGGCTTGAGINAGHLRFAQVSTWESVPVGTVIVLYNGADNCYGFTSNETGSGGQYFINVGSTTLIERTTTRPTTTDCDYCGATYAAPGSSPWNTIALSNTADAIQVRCPDCPASEAGFFHGVAYGSGFGGITAGASDLGGAYFSGTGSARTYELTGAGSPGAEANWTRTTAPNGGGTAPASVGVVDAGVIAWLESATLACCGSFEPPVVVQKNGYRFGFQGQEKDDEIYGSTGTSYDFGARMYDPRVGRWLKLDPKASALPGWSPYVFGSSNPLLFIDPDGQLPWTFHVRSFIATSTTGGGLFRGDGRGPSLEPSPQATSRVRSSFVVDPTAGTISKPQSVSDPTVRFVPFKVKSGSPTATIGGEKFSPGTATFGFHHSGKDPITPAFVTPALDVYSGMQVTENVEKGTLSIIGIFSGDGFPSTEAFVTDQSGNNKVFLGAAKETGGLLDLYKDGGERLFSVNMTINFDTEGNFTSVQQGDKTYSVEEWNKTITDGFDKTDD